MRRLLFWGLVAIVAAIAVALGNTGPIARAGSGGSISGIVYFDKDMDGEREGGEALAPDRTVQLLDDESVPLGPIAKSAADGSYRFGDLSPGTYYGVSVLRDTDTPCIDGETSFFDGAEKSEDDLGVLPPGDGSLGGTLVSDLNENGARDSSEPGLEDWQMRLMGYLGNAECEADATTDKDGQFELDGLYGGIYGIIVENTASDLEGKVSWRVTFIDRPADAPAAYPNAGSADRSVDLTNSKHAQGVVIGLHVLSSTGSVNAWIFDDSDLDGTMDTGEEPFDCCGIMLLQSSPAGFLPLEPGEPRVSTGEYQWQGLPAGDYKVALLTWRPASTAPTEQDGRPARTFTLHDGETFKADFGFGPLPPDSDQDTSRTPVPTVSPSVEVTVVPPGSGSGSYVGDQLWRDVQAAVLGFLVVGVALGLALTIRRRAQ